MVSRSRRFTRSRPGSVSACARVVFAGGHGGETAFGSLAIVGSPTAQAAFAFFDLPEQERARVVREAAIRSISDHDAVISVENERRRVAQRLAVEVEVQVVAAKPGEAADLGWAELHAPHGEE